MLWRRDIERICSWLKASDVEAFTWTQCLTYVSESLSNSKWSEDDTEGFSVFKPENWWNYRIMLADEGLSADVLSSYVPPDNPDRDVFILQKTQEFYGVDEVEWGEIPNEPNPGAFRHIKPLINNYPYRPELTWFNHDSKTSNT